MPVAQGARGGATGGAAELNPSWLARHHGLGVALLFIGAAYALEATGMHLPSPSTLCVTGVAYAAFAGGWRQGAVAALLAFVYLALPIEAHRVEGGLFSSPSARRLGAIALALGTVVVLIAILQARVRRQREAERRAAAELAAAEERARAAEQARLHEQRYRLFFESSPQPMWVYDTEHLRFLAVNNAAVAAYGYSRGEFERMTLADVRPPEDVPEMWRAVRAPETEQWRHAGFWTHVRKNGERVEVQIASHSLEFDGRPARLAVITDVTERVRAQQELLRSKHVLEQAQGVARLGYWTLSLGEAGVRVEGVVSDEALRVLGVDRAGFDGSRAGLFVHVHEDDREMLKVLWALATAGSDTIDAEVRVLAGQRTRWAQLREELQRDDDGRIVGVIGVVQDVSERHAAEAEAREWRNRYEAASLASRQALYEWSPQTGMVLWGEGARAVLGCDPAEINTLPKFKQRIHPEDHHVFDTAIEATTRRMESFLLRYRFRRDDGTYRHVEDHARYFYHADGTATRLVGFVSDVTDRVEAAAELERRAHELARSNAELERFAYVASHDLQEPLRMVISFTQLLARRYRGRLDSDADEFIGYAVEGATRMQQLIDDLLAYSRVSTRPRLAEVFDLSVPVERALGNLRTALEESGAAVSAGPLGLVRGDPAQLTLVFQNLIGNAVKFRGERTPAIEVSAEVKEGMLEARVRDNGIGVPERHRDRIFTMFQRLHPRSAYPGNGIGLAICKRVVEGHGGKMWVEDAPGGGSIFCLTLPAGAGAEAGPTT